VVLLLLLVGLLAPVAAPDDPAGAAWPVVAAGPPWAWRPAHAELVREGIDAGGAAVLQALDPATGRIGELAPVGRIRAAVRRVPMPVRPIGRAGVPKLVWAPDGNAVVVVANGDLVWRDLRTGFTRRLTTTTAPLTDIRVAPDGRHVSFARDDDLWVVATDEGRPRRLTHGGSEERRNATLDWVYPEELGLQTAAWWSPDAGRIAYLAMDERGVRRIEIPVEAGRTRTMRYPRAGEQNPRVRVGVVAAAGGPTTWLDLGSNPWEYVVRLAWFPDGRRVAVAVMDRAQQTLCLLACPADGGSPSEILRDTDDAWLDAPPAPRFVGENRFLWRRFDPGGRVAWYLVTGDGSAPARFERLTAPDADVPAPPYYDRRTGEAHYLAEVDDGLRRRPRVGPGGGEAPYAPPPGFDTALSIDDTGTFAVVEWSRTTEPPRSRVRRVDDGRAVLEIALPERVRRTRRATPEVEVGRFDGPVRWRLWHPPGGGDGPRPLVLLVYGGPGARRVEDRWSPGLQGEADRYLRRGWYVLEADGRGASGFGRDVVRVVGGRLGLPQIEDQVRAVRRIAKRPEIDASRVGIVGWSFGGTMACLGMTLYPDVFRAGVAIAPVTDWRLYDTIYTERYLGLPDVDGEGYRRSSPATYAADLEGPLLLVHGGADDNVHVANTLRFAAAAGAAGCDAVEMRLYPAVGHGMGRHYRDAIRETAAFFDRHL
jgi:dipeptidyl-peptidase-4